MSDEKKIVEPVVTTETKKTDIPDDPHYAAQTKDGWGIEMNGLEAADGSDIDHAGILGMPMTDFTIEAKGIKKARVRNKRGKWLEYKTGFNKDTGFGDGTNITGIEIVGSGFCFSVHIKGGQWLPSLITSDVEGDVLAVSGAAIDAIWVDKI